MPVRLLLAMLALVGCATTTPNLVHSVASETGTNTHEDEVARVTVTPSATRVPFIIENVSKVPIRVLWDEAAIITPDRETERVFHSGVKFVERGQAQSPTVIYPGAKITDALAPASRAYFESGRSGGWNNDPILRREWYGKVWRVVIPVLVEGAATTRVYEFSVVSTEAGPEAASARSSATSAPIDDEAYAR